jgi:transposase-like protein
MFEPKTLREAILYFSNADNCLKYMVARRWPDGVICPTCGRADARFLANQRKWQCKSVHAKRQFTLKTGTIMEDSPIGLEKWLPAMWLICSAKNGISSYELSRALGITQKSTWFMLHRIRAAMKSGSFLKLGSGGGIVEADETFIGGKPKNMHKSKRPKGTGNTGKIVGGMAKTIVVGMLERNGRVRAHVVSDRNSTTLHALVAKNVHSDATLMTDEWGGYRGSIDAHEIINHACEYVNGHVHTNGIENFWCLLKRGLMGTYVNVEPFHLGAYLDEQIFRYENRATKDHPLNDADRMSLAVSQIVGKRLTYAELTGKVMGAEL